MQMVIEEHEKRLRFSHLYLLLPQSALGARAAFVPCLLVLIIVDALANPYAGLVHDARLYALQAMRHLEPAWYDKDLFFLFGSQDSYTLFSFFLAPLVDMFGLERGMILLYGLSRVFFLLAILLFNHQFTGKLLLGLLASIILMAGKVQYFFFDLNEPFLTPRLISVAFSLLSLWALLRQKNGFSVICLLMASLLHPLIALGPALVLVLMLIGQAKRQRSLVLCSLLAVSCLLLIVFLSFSDRFLDSTMFMDEEWATIVFSRSVYLNPWQWPAEHWGGAAAALLIACLGSFYLESRRRLMILVILGAAVVGVVATLLLVQFYPLALPLQLQPWRWYWMLRLVTVPLCLVTSVVLWKKDHFLTRMAAILIIGPAVLGGGADNEGLVWFLLAGLLLLLSGFMTVDPERRYQHGIFIAVAATLMLLPLSAVILNFQTYFEWPDFRTGLLTVISILEPLFRPLAVVVGICLFCWRWLFDTRYGWCLLLIACLALVAPAINYDIGYPHQVEADRNFIKMDTKPAFKQWATLVSPGSMVLSDNSLPVAYIWFVLRSACYFSKLQGAGVIFNRDLAMTWQKRAGHYHYFMTTDLGKTVDAWLEEKNITHVISRRKLALPVIAREQGITLYDVRGL